MPVSQYPEFPDSGTLTNTGELIQLYNKLCAGKKTDFVLTDGNKRKRWFAGGIAGAIASGILGWFIWRDVFTGSIIKIIVLGLIIGITSILGDLSESVFDGQRHSRIRIDFVGRPYV